LYFQYIISIRPWRDIEPVWSEKHFFPENKPRKATGIIKSPLRSIAKLFTQAELHHVEKYPEYIA